MNIRISDYIKRSVSSLYTFYKKSPIGDDNGGSVPISGRYNIEQSVEDMFSNYVFPYSPNKDFCLSMFIFFTLMACGSGGGGGGGGNSNGSGSKPMVTNARALELMKQYLSCVDGKSTTISPGSYITANNPQKTAEQIIIDELKVRSNYPTQTVTPTANCISGNNKYALDYNSSVNIPFVNEFNNHPIGDTDHYLSIPQTINEADIVNVLLDIAAGNVKMNNSIDARLGWLGKAETGELLAAELGNPTLKTNSNVSAQLHLFKFDGANYSQYGTTPLVNAGGILSLPVGYPVDDPGDFIWVIASTVKSGIDLSNLDTIMKHLGDINLSIRAASHTSEEGLPPGPP